jgi:hypothetical protein
MAHSLMLIKSCIPVLEDYVGDDLATEVALEALEDR